MMWILAAVAIVLLAVVFFAYAYKLAVREGLDAQNKDLPRPRQTLSLVWRGFGLMTGDWLSELVFLVGAIVFLPILLIASPINPSESRWARFFVGRMVVFSLVLAGAVYYLAEFRVSYLGYLALLPAAWAGLGLIGTLLELSQLPDSSDRRKKSSLPLSERLEKLEKCGVRLRPGASLDALRKVDSDSFLDAEGYDGIVMIMGGYGMGLDEPAFSDDVWYNDIECITEPEDYARVAKHLQRLSKGDFAIENVRAETDEDGAEVTLKFTLHGKEYDLRAPLDDDMIEVEVWAELQSLFESCCKGRRRLEKIYYGQDGCYFYITPEQKACLKKLGLVFFN